MPKKPPYSFERAIDDPFHFINRVIDYVASRTDAAYDYAEAGALFLLAAASTGLKIPGAGVDGMRCNLYVALCGTTNESRKSTVLGLIEHILEAAIDGASAASDFTAVALLEMLEEQSGKPTCLVIDELADVFEGIKDTTYMKKVRSLLLTFFSKSKKTYRRGSENLKSKRGENKIEVHDAYLNMIGCLTPAIRERLEVTDIQDGLLGRMLFCNPTSKPAMKKRLTDNDTETPRELARWLLDAYTLCQELAGNSGDPLIGNNVIISEEASDIHFEFEQFLSTSTGLTDDQMSMISRLSDQCLKASVLVALGSVTDFDAVRAVGKIVVSAEHMKQTIRIIRKYLKFSVDFVQGMGRGDVEREILNITNKLNEAPDYTLPRGELSSRCRLISQTMKDVMMTMNIREMIDIKKENIVRQNGSKSERKTELWTLREKWREKPRPASNPEDKPVS